MSKNPIYEPMVPRAVQRLPIRGADYCVHEWGSPSSPMLLYLHGWADTGSTFQFVVDSFRADWYVVAPDWRGFGRSSCCCSSYWFPDYIADLHELLERFSPGGPARVIGHSMGANVAALYAGTMPERVQAFINIEGFGLKDSDPADAPANYRSWIEAANDAPGFTEYDGIEVLAERLLKRHPSMGIAGATFVAGEWASQGPDGIVRLRADPLHKLPNPVLYRRAEARACWRAITADVLAVRGSRSRFGDEPGEAPAALFPNCKEVAIDGAGHMLHFEEPTALAGAIEDFLLPSL